MYAVVGCGECQALWLGEGRAETSQCPRCGTTRPFEKRKQFVTTENEDHAREVRASMLASRQGHGDAFAKVDSFAELETQLDEVGIDDETYLEDSGIDPEEVAAAADRLDSSGSSQSRDAIVRDAVAELDDPDRAAVVEYASERAVPPERAERLLDKLVRSGAVSESGGTYRLL
jgi:hypothetical protein